MSLISTLYDSAKITNEIMAQNLLGQVSAAAQNASGTSSGVAATSSTKDTMVLSPQALAAAQPYISENYKEALSSTLADGTLATVAKRIDTAEGEAAKYTVNITEPGSGAGFSLDFTGDMRISKNSDGGYSFYNNASDTTHILGADGSRSEVGGNAINADANTLYVSTSGNAIATGNGNNTIFVYGDNASVTGGSGNDTVVLNSGLSNVTVNTGEGNDTVTSGGVLTDSTIDLGEGNNTLAVKNLDGGSVSAGDGNNTIRVSYAKNDASIALGNGGNKTEIYSLSDNSSLSIGNGHGWTQVLSMTDAASVSFGNGDNTAYIGYATGNASISFGDGNNDIIASRLRDDSSLVLGHGNNIARAGLGGNASLTAGDGDNVIRTDDMNGSASISAGNGNNAVNAGDMSGSASISLGHGNNKINASGMSGDASMSLGDGSNSVSAGDLSGNSSITVGDGYSHVIAGNLSGNASVTIGKHSSSWASISSFSGGSSLTIRGTTYNEKNPYNSVMMSIDVSGQASALYNEHISSIIAGGTDSDYPATGNREKALAAYSHPVESASTSVEGSGVESSGETSE